MALSKAASYPWLVKKFDYDSSDEGFPLPEYSVFDDGGAQAGPAGCGRSTSSGKVMDGTGVRKKAVEPRMLKLLRDCSRRGRGRLAR